MTDVNQARFLINDTPPVDPASGNRGYAAAPGQTLTLTLERDPSPALSVLYEVFDPADPQSPLASKDAPPIVFVESGTTKALLQSPNDSAHITMPPAGVHSYILRATVSMPGGPEVLERMVALPKTGTTPTIRKTVPGETVQYEIRGFSDSLNDFADAIGAGGFGGNVSLNDAYQEGRAISVDTGAVELVNEDGDNSSILKLSQNDATNSPHVLEVENNADGFGASVLLTGISRTLGSQADSDCNMLHIGTATSADHDIDQYLMLGAYNFGDASNSGNSTIILRAGNVYNSTGRTTIRIDADTAIEVGCDVLSQADIKIGTAVLGGSQRNITIGGHSSQVQDLFLGGNRIKLVGGRTTIDSESENSIEIGCSIAGAVQAADVRIATAGADRAVNIGTTDAGVVNYIVMEADGNITQRTGGADHHVFLDAAGGELRFSDSYCIEASWPQPFYVRLADNASQWEAYLAAFGHDSLMYAILKAYERHPYMVTDSTGDQPITDTEETVTLNDEAMTSTKYSLAADEVAVADAGTYLISYCCSYEITDTAGGSEGSMTCHVEDDSGGSYAATPGSWSSSYHNENAGKASNQCTFLKVLSAGSKIRLIAQRTNGTTNIDTVQNETSLTIIKVA